MASSGFGPLTMDTECASPPEPPAASPPRRRRKQAGHAVLEVALTLPWLLFLFVGGVDIGFYAYALTAMQNAARAAALYTSSSSSTATDATTACSTYVLPAMQHLPNTPNLTVCTALPLLVTATSVTGPDGSAASRVSVQYQSPKMVPIPGLLSGQITFTRSVTMRVKS